jgi:hypothetical protein
MERVEMKIDRDLLEAMRLAVEEQHAWRRERRERETKPDTVEGGR